MIYPIVDRTPEGNFDVEILGEHDIEKLDELSDDRFNLSLLRNMGIYGLHVLREFIKVRLK